MKDKKKPKPTVNTKSEPPSDVERARLLELVRQIVARYQVEDQPGEKIA